MEDYLFYCTGECEDSMRDRDFYLVKNCPGEDSAREVLAEYFIENGCDDSAENYSVFVHGEELEDGATGEHWAYRMHIMS